MSTMTDRPPIDPHLIVVTTDPINAETPLALQRGVVTPNRLFFYRNRFTIPQIDPETWRLTVTGEVVRDLRFTYADLLALPRRSWQVTLECAGNGRIALEPAAEGEPWAYGAVSTAEWAGVPLALLLAEAGVREAAREIVFHGEDGGAVQVGGPRIPFARSLPREVALGGEAIVAHSMNGEPLPVDHGFPARLIVPGWYGMASVKWLTRIEAVSQPFEGFFQSERYVVADDSGGTRPVSRVRVRSLIVDPPDGGRVGRSGRTVRGLAWSGGGPVTAVEFSADGGATWSDTEWTSEAHPFAWRSWETTWLPAAGPAVLCSRARDAAGNVQPEIGPWNELGYENNGIQRVTVIVDGE